MMVSTWEQIAAFIGIVTAFVTAAFVWRQSWNGYRLLRRLNAGKTRGSFRRVLRTLAHIALRHPKSLASRERPFFDYVRIRAEHEIFDPRPIWQWPLPDDHDDYGKEGLSLDFRGKNRSEMKKIRKDAYAETKEKYKVDLRTWRDRIAEIYKKTEIRLETAGDLNSSLSEIKRYFDTLKTLDIDIDYELRFISSVNIDTGFLAPQHLLAGLLVRYNEKWGDIIAGFEDVTTDFRDLDSDMRRRDFRQVQSFIYHCWLLWGPSIPVCDHHCHAWHADYGTLQYGYGDENNSIEIVGEFRLLREQFNSLIARVGAARAMAVPASVKGQLQYSSIAALNKRTIPEALQYSWGGRQDERPILFVSREYTPAYGEEHDGESYRTTGGIRELSGATDPGGSRYYSAYLWIMFVILRKRGKEWVPIHAQHEPERGYKLASEAPWKATIPFFEHGNLADGETCSFTKRQLAEKALSGLVQLAEMLPPGPTVHKFAYACAIDDSSCSVPLAFPDLAGGDTIAELMRRRLAADPGAFPAAAIDFDYYRPQPPDQGNPHSACAQTYWVSEHYKVLDSLTGRQ